MEGNSIIIAAVDKINFLKRAGVNISLTSFHNLENNKIEITFTGTEDKKFIISTDGTLLFLENQLYRKPDGRPVFESAKDMVDYVLVLTNGGPIPHIIDIPEEEEKKIFKERVVVPT